MTQENTFDTRPTESIFDRCGPNTQRQQEVDQEAERAELKAFLELF